MKFRALLNILIAYILLFPAGVTKVGADAISQPVAVTVAAPANVNGEMDSKPVSVSVGAPTGVNGADSKPVSVSVAAPAGVNSAVDSKPVSVSVSAPANTYSGISTKSVSVGFAASAADGTYAGGPVSVKVNPENQYDPDLVGLWHMDGDWRDSSGNNNDLSSTGSTTFSLDKKVGIQSGSYNGSSFLSNACPSGLNLMTNFTIMGWIKPTLAQLGGILDSGLETAGSWELWYESNGSISYRQNWSRSQGQESAVTAAATVPLNTWTHFAAVYTDKHVTLYVNGIATATATFNNNPVFSGSEWFEIGVHRPGSDVYFNGLLDEVAVYKRTLAAEEIALYANAGIVDPSLSLSLNTVPAIVGTSTITLSGSKTIGTSIWVNDKKIAPVDTAATSWQGTYGTLQSGMNLLNVVAVDSTFKQSPPVTATVIYDNTLPVIESSYPANNSNTAKQVTSVTINLTDAYSAINLQASIEGATVKNSTGLISGSWTTSGTKTITFVPDAPLQPDTYLVTIYPVDAVGNKGHQQIVFTNHDTSSPVTTIVLSGTKGNDGWYYSTVNVTLSADDGSEGSGIQKIEYSFDGNAWQVYGAPFVMDKDGINKLYCRSTDNIGNIETPAKTVDVKINKTGLVGLWHMDNNGNDASMLGNDVSAVNGATFSPDAKIGTNSAQFNGSNSYLRRVSGNSLPLGNSPRTLMAWIKPFSYPDGTYNGIIAYGQRSNSTGSLLSIKNDGRLSMAFWYNDAFQTSGPAATLNDWNHVALTYDGGTKVKFYMNGVFAQESALGGPANTQDGPIRIGCTDDPGRVFNGLIDEVAIYNRALSETEIQENYRSYKITPPTVVSVQTPTTSSAITLSGTKPANTAIVVNGTTIVPLDNQPAWQASYNLQPGMNNLNISAMDVDGFRSQAVTVSVALDISAPTVSSTNPVNNGALNTSVAAITFNLSEPFSAIDLNATLTGASVTRSSGADPSGSWITSGGGSTATIKFTPMISLGEGTYTATINPTDTLGNHSTASITFTVDATPPPPPTIDPIPLPSRTSTRTITGTKSLDSARVVVACAGATFGTVSYPTSFTWSVTVSGLHEGSNTVTAYAVDAATNPSASTQMTFMVDTIPPAAPVVNPTSTPTKQNSITFTGTKEAGSYLFINNIKTQAAYSDTAWSYPVNFASEGNNTYVFVAQDEAGNPSQSVTVTVVKDTTAPVISLSTPTANSFTNQATSISVLLSDANSTVDLQGSLSGAIVTNSAGSAVAGSWSVQGGWLVFTPSATMSDNTYTVTVHPVDAPLGNTGTSSFTFTLDSASPIVQSLTMNPTSPHKAETIQFAITFSEDMLTTMQPTVSFTRGLLYSTYTIPSGTWTNSKTWTGSYTFTSNTGDGTYTVKVADAKDKAGNTMSAQSLTDVFVLDTTSPSAPVLNAVTTPTNNPNQILSGAKEASTAVIINNQQRVALNANTTWSYSYPLSEGTNTLSVAARDAAANDSIATSAIIVLDTTPPMFTINPYQNPSPAASQTLTGTKEPGCIVKICVNKTCEQIFGNLDLISTWTSTVELVSGITNSFTFSAADALGNTTTKVVNIYYDNAPPAPISVLNADGRGKGNEITLSWAGYPEAPDVGYYAVYQSLTTFTDVTSMPSITTVNNGVKTYKATGLIKGTPYYFAVVPVDNAGNKINTVNVASAVPTDTMAPEDVTNLAATAGYTAVQGNFITLIWTASADSTHDLMDQVLYVDSGAGYNYNVGIPLGKSATTYTTVGLLDAKNYRFKITVKDNSGHESQQGTVVEAITRLANPANFAAAPGNGKVVLNWSAVSSTYAPYVKQYNIYRVISDTLKTDISQMTKLPTQNLKLTTYTDTGLTNDTTYQYAVTVLNTSGAERTDVQSVSATPRSDSTGPVIDTFNIIAGQVVTAPITISATAHDAESTMGSMELSVDGTVVATQSGGSISYFWNVVAPTDGNHVIKLRVLDTLGNPTEDSRQVIVSLAPPAIPAITGNVVSQTTPTYTVSVSGTAPLFTMVTIKVNGTVVNTTQTAGTTGTGTFSFSSIALTEGDNLLAVKASHRGGDSAYSPDYKITVDTGAPPAPQNLTVQVLTGGIVRFTWSNSSGEIPSGYNLYMGTSSFTSTSGAAKVNTTPITYLLNEYNPGDDGLKYYAVTALDSAGNESGISNVVAVSTDRTAPSVLDIQYTQNSQPVAANAAVGQGSIDVAVTVNEKLREMPFFSLEPQEGTPIIVAMSMVDDMHYTGSFIITDQSPQGPTTYKFSGKDMIGNRGNAQGTGITIDVQGPVAAIQSPLTTLKITANPVAVNIVFNEPSTTTPSLTLTATGGATALISNMTSTDNGIHWTGTLNVSGMPEGKAEFILSGATDLLGNIGTNVLSGRYILLYLNGIAPPGIPEGLATKSDKAGSIVLTWYPVANPNSDLTTLTYNLYRRADGESAPTKVQTSIGAASQNATTTQDTPPSDGIYYYEVSSVGLLGSESPASAEVQALSDRIGPPAPTNLNLVLTGSGVSASWDEVVDYPSPLPPSASLPLKGYNLYRSNGPISSTTGLTPVAKSAINSSVDTSPSRAYKFYALAAVDYLGNEGPLSNTVAIDFSVAPVRNLVFERIDNAAPTITWQAPVDSDSIAGYYIYRNRSRIIDYPVTDLSYTDGNYTSGTIYGISAVDNTGKESPINEVSVPELTLGIKDGASLRRGLLETIPIIVTSGSSVGMSIDSIDVMVGTAPSSSIQGPFDLGANTTLQLEKVAATTVDAQSPVPVYIRANWSPSPGVTVKLSHTVAVEVLGSSSSLEIFNDPLVRGTDAKVQIKVNNIGTAQMEIVTSENNTKTMKVRINLKDQDGNILSTGYLDQQFGNAVVNVAGYALARINPNESFMTDPILLSVPASAPYKVIIEAMIENTYYHYSMPEQVTAPGMMGTAEASIQETLYRASATPDKSFYAMGEPVVISGSAISNDSANSTQLMPNVPVKIGISLNGFDRFYTVTTDASGRFTYTFTPGNNEAGSYNLWAAHPDINDRTVQATFAVAGITTNPSSVTISLARNRSIDVPVTISNHGETYLTGLTFETTSSSGIASGVINSGDTILTAGEKQSIIWRITVDITAPDTGSATLKATTAEGLSVTLNASISVVSLSPIISTSPSYIDTGMVRGDQKIATITITNTGEDTLRNARIEGPSTSWISLTQNKAIGDIAPGASAPVGFLLSPPDNLAQGIYDDQVIIYSDNHVPYTYHIQVTVSSTAVGSVYFTVQDMLAEQLADTTITFQHQLLRDLIYTAKTGANGTVLMNDIPEGSYVFNVTPPPGHMPYSGTFVVSPGMTTTASIVLDVKLVDVTWSVVPTTIQDQYEIVITQTFQTNVPLPVLVVEPPIINLPDMQPGQVFNGEFTVKNYGLIAVDDVTIAFPTSFLDYDIDVLTAAVPNRIGAMESITVPYRVTKHQVVSSLFSVPDSVIAGNGEPVLMSLFDEVRGYGAGSGCSTSITVSGKAEICLVTGQIVHVSASFTISRYQSNATGADCGGGGGWDPHGGGSGAAGGAGSTPLITANSCNCKPDCTQTDDCKGEYRCIKGECRKNTPTLPDDWFLDIMCPNRVDNPQAGKYNNGCGPDPKMEAIANALGGTSNDPMGNGLSSFEPCCGGHDACYGTCRSNKTVCDLTFYFCLGHLCNTVYPGLIFSLNNVKCQSIAAVYGTAVSTLGDSSYFKRQHEGCNCCPY